MVTKAKRVNGVPPSEFGEYSTSRNEDGKEIAIALVNTLQKAIKSCGHNVMDLVVNFDNICGYRFKASVEVGDKMEVFTGELDKDTSSVTLDNYKEFKDCDSQKPTEYFDSLTI